MPVSVSVSASVSVSVSVAAAAAAAGEWHVSSLGIFQHVLAQLTQNYL